MGQSLDIDDSTRISTGRERGQEVSLVIWALESEVQTARKENRTRWLQHT